MSTSPRLNREGFYDILPMPPGRQSDLFAVSAQIMACVHNIIIRGIDSMLYHAPRISEAEVPYFMEYCLAFAHFVHHHHANEEEYYFPALEKKLGSGSMGRNIVGHEAFHPPFDAFSDLCSRIKVDHSLYDSMGFVESIHTFAPPLIQHLTEEIGTLDAEMLRKSMTPEELRDIEKGMEKRVQNSMSIVENFPWAIVNNDDHSAGWFIPLPMVVNLVITWVVVPWKAKVWRYGTSTSSQVLKPEFAALTCAPPPP